MKTLTRLFTHRQTKPAFFAAFYTILFNTAFNTHWTLGTLIGLATYFSLVGYGDKRYTAGQQNMLVTALRNRSRLAKGTKTR